MDNKLLIQDLAEAIATKEGLTKKKSEAFIKALFETIEEGLAADKFVKIKGLGTFKIISVGERESVNINTGERFSIEGHEKITFTPDTMLKDLVNRPFAHFQTVIINDDTNIEEMESVEDEDQASETSPNDEDTTVLNDSNPDGAEKMAEEPSNDAEDILDKATPTEVKTLAEEETPAEAICSGEEPIAVNPAVENKSENQQPTPTVSQSEEEVSKETPNAFAGISEPMGIESTATSEEANPGSPTTNASDLETSTLDDTVSENLIQPDDTSSENVTTSVEAPVKEEQMATLSESVITTPHEQVPDTEHEPSLANEEETEAEKSTAGTGAEGGGISQNANIVPEKEAEEETNNESQQQIKYIIKELETKRNTWKTISLILLSVLLLMLSYFAGYFRWFCPCETTPLHLSPQNNSCPVPIQEEVPAIGIDSVKDTIFVAPKDSIAETEPIPEAKMKPDNKAPEKVVTTTPTKPMKKERQQVAAPAEKKQKNTDPENNFKQLEGGKYKIVGTLGTHKIENGETIRTIALDVYGSKGYYLYIITHNDLENPNMVDTGTIIKLPKLEKRKK